MQLKNTLFALSNILDAAEGESEFGQLDRESRAVLKFVGANEASGTEVCVKDITQNPALPGSPVTLMKRIHMLQETGWLVTGTSELHHRRVRLRLSAKSLRELNNTSTRLEQSLKSVLK